MIAQTGDQSVDVWNVRRGRRLHRCVKVLYGTTGRGRKSEAGRGGVAARRWGQGSGRAQCATIACVVIVIPVIVIEAENVYEGRDRV